MESRVKGLDLLRLLAVLGVIVFHYAYRGAAADHLTVLSVPDWRPVAQYGYLGVHLFFVISGFVIARSTEGRSPLQFIAARLMRIYPAFFLCMTITCLLSLQIGGPVFSSSLSQWVANLVIFAPALHQPFMDGAYWSIVYEIVFYGWVALLLTRRIIDRYTTALVLAWIAVSVANEAIGPSIALRRLFLTDASGFFLCGMLIHQLSRNGSSALRWVLLALSAELAAGQAVIASRYNVVHLGADLSKGVIVTIALASIASVGLCTVLKRDLLSKRVTAVIGGLTYPLYLLHQHVGYMIFNRLGDTYPAEAVVMATTVAMLALALVIHLAMERPAQRYLKRSVVPNLARWGAGWRVRLRPTME